MNSNTDLQILTFKEVKKPRQYIGQLEEICGAVWPAYLNQGHFITLYDEALMRLPEYQYAMIDMANGTLVSTLLAVPMAFMGDYDQLPDEGWDWAIREGLAQAKNKKIKKNALCVLEMTIRPEYQGKLLSKKMLKHVMKQARERGFERIFGPARPNDKVGYPNVDIERYVTWRNTKGKHIDSWLRFHEMLTGRIHKPCARSMTVTGAVEQWEGWVGKSFPETGDYIIEGGLSMLHIDRERDLGTYVEPNVWMIYTVEDPSNGKN